MLMEIDIAPPPPPFIPILPDPNVKYLLKPLRCMVIRQRLSFFDSQQR